jgi:hypothetical protein
MNQTAEPLVNQSLWAAMWKVLLSPPPVDPSPTDEPPERAKTEENSQ